MKLYKVFSGSMESFDSTRKDKLFLDVEHRKKDHVYKSTQNNLLFKAYRSVFDIFLDDDLPCFIPGQNIYQKQYEIFEVFMVDGITDNKTPNIITPKELLDDDSFVIFLNNNDALDRFLVFSPDSIARVISQYTHILGGKNISNYLQTFPTKINLILNYETILRDVRKVTPMLDRLDGMDLVNLLSVRPQLIKYFSTKILKKMTFFDTLLLIKNVPELTEKLNISFDGTDPETLIWKFLIIYDPKMFNYVPSDIRNGQDFNHFINSYAFTFGKKG